MCVCVCVRERERETERDRERDRERQRQRDHDLYSHWGLNGTPLRGIIYSSFCNETKAYVGILNDCTFQTMI